MRNYIIADNQELTAYALQSLLKRDEGSAIFRAVDRSGLTELLKEHEDAVVFLDYTLFDFADEDQLLIVAERFSLSEWILISDELTPQFVRRVVYSSHLRRCRPSAVIHVTSASGHWKPLFPNSRKKRSPIF